MFCLHGTLVVFRCRTALIAGKRSHVDIAELQTAAGSKTGSSVHVRGAAWYRRNLRGKHLRGRGGRVVRCGGSGRFITSLPHRAVGCKLCVRAGMQCASVQASGGRGLWRWLPGRWGRWAGRRRGATSVSLHRDDQALGAAAVAVSVHLCAGGAIKAFDRTPTSCYMARHGGRGCGMRQRRARSGSPRRLIWASLCIATGSTVRRRGCPARCTAFGRGY
jgi:hypothetical protein